MSRPQLQSLPFQPLTALLTDAVIPRTVERVRVVLVLLVVATIVLSPLGAAAAALCRDLQPASCCCGDESACPCAHGHDPSPAPDPSVPADGPRPATEHGLLAATVIGAIDLQPRIWVAQVDATATAESGRPSVFLSGCTFRC